MKNYKPYLYRNPKIAAPDYDLGKVVTRTGSQEQLTGVIQNMKASDIEERAAIAVSKIDIAFQFRARITSPSLGRQRLTRNFANVRGEVEIDLLCERNGFVTPVFIDGEISHFFTPYQAENDRFKTAMVNEFGARLGWREAVRIPFWRLSDQATADKTMREIFV